AAQRAADQLAYDEAVALFQRALDIAQANHEPAAVEAKLLEELGAAQHRAGDPAHRDTLLRAGHLARECGETDVLVRAAVDIARVAAVLEVDPARVELYEWAREATEGTHTADRARLLSCLSYELSFTAERERAMRLSDEAMALARAHGSLSDIAFVLSMRVN